MAASSASASKSSSTLTDTDSEIVQMLFEQQVLIPLFTRIKHKGCQKSDFQDIKKILLFIFDSFKFQKRKFLKQIFLKNKVYGLIFDRPNPIFDRPNPSFDRPNPIFDRPNPIEKVVEKPVVQTRKRPNVIVFKEVPWFVKKQKLQRTEALKKTLENEAKLEIEAAALEAESGSPEIITICDEDVKVEADYPSNAVLNFAEQTTITELCSPEEDDEEEGKGSNATEKLVKLIVDTYSKETPSEAISVNIKEESIESIEVATYDESSGSYLNTLLDIKSEPFESVNYDISPSNKKRFSKNLEGHNLYYVVAKYYYDHWDVFKDWSNRTPETTRRRTEAWNDIFLNMERDGIKDFNRESLPVNFRKFVSKLRTKKRNQLSGTAPDISFTQQEEEILEYENSYIRLKRKCITLKD